jgi:hypothetical protein
LGRVARGARLRHGRQEVPAETPTKYATSNEVQAALKRARDVLATYLEKRQQQVEHAAPIDPGILKIRELQRRRHARKDAEVEDYRRLEFARQEREDKAITEFGKWEPPKDSRLM